MNKEYFESHLNSIPKETKRFSDLTFNISQIIFNELKKRNLSKKQFAKIVNKKKSRIDLWLNGVYNFSLKEISLIEQKLDLKLINVKSPFQEFRYIPTLKFKLKGIPKLKKFK